MKKIVLMLLFVLALTPAAVSAQSLNGSIYAAQGAPTPILFTFSVSGQTFVATILTFGGGGNGRWFAAFGTTDGVSGTGQVVNPSGFAFTQPAGALMQFQLDQPGGPGGSFTIKGLEAFLSVSTARFVRVFP
jgi:hypothetical protein